MSGNGPDQALSIAAIATAVAPGQGGIAVIRLSGPSAVRAVAAITVIPGQQVWESHRVLYGHVVAADGVERLDEVLVLVMLAPRSFSGEDVVEIHCQGGDPLCAKAYGWRLSAVRTWAKAPCSTC